MDPNRPWLRDDHLPLGENSYRCRVNGVVSYHNISEICKQNPSGWMVSLWNKSWLSRNSLDFKSWRFFRGTAASKVHVCGVGVHCQSPEHSKFNQRISSSIPHTCTVKFDLGIRLFELGSITSTWRWIAARLVNGLQLLSWKLHQTVGFITMANPCFKMQFTRWSAAKAFFQQLATQKKHVISWMAKQYPSDWGGLAPFV